MSTDSPTASQTGSPGSGTTPARREEHSTSPALPGPVQSAEQLPDIDPPRDIGWAIILGGSIAMLLSSWMLFGVEADGMWAGYWGTMLGTFGLGAACLLRSTLPRMPGYLLAGASGAGLVLVGIVQGYPAIITIPLIACGAAMVAGTGIAASARR